MFDDALLEDDRALAAHDAMLRHLASLGARIRIEAESVRDYRPDQEVAPRGIVVVGPEARLVRAVLEPMASVPLVAWPYPGLPGWVGPLDLVIVLSDDGFRETELRSVVEAVKRGSTLLVAAPGDSPVARQSSSRSTLLVPTKTRDPLAAAIAVLSVLHILRLGPTVRADDVAEAADMVAERCSPHRDLSSNPAKDLALGLGDALPLVWGGTVLAARASRRIAEAIRRASGRPALAADAEALLPVIRGAATRDVFADPFEDAAPERPVLVMLDDPDEEESARAARSELRAAATAQRVRVCEITPDAGTTSVDRYVALLQHGLFGAAYLQIGLSA